MTFLKNLTNVFQSFKEWTSKDEIVFGEIVRSFVKKGHPVIGFDAEPGKQSARFLIDDETLFAFRITLDKKLGAASVLNVVAEVRNKLSDPDDMIEMFKTDLTNIAKIPLFGQIRINHEYNTIYASTSVVKSLNTYLGQNVGDVDSEALESDLEDMISKLSEALRRFKKA